MTYKPPVLSLLGAIAILAVAAPGANAGDYEVSACDGEPVNNSWQYETNDTNTTQSISDCPAQNEYTGLVATTNLTSQTSPVRGVYARWVAHAPPETRITRARLRRWLGMEGSTGWEVYGRTPEGTISGETCTVSGGAFDCNVGGYTSPTVELALNTSSLAYGVTCISMFGCTTGATIHDARAAIYSAELTITDNVEPSLGTPSGRLVTDSGYHRGVETATVTASDSAGIKRLRAVVDGHAVDPGDRVCDWTRMAPCPSSADPQTVALDTRSVPDGVRKVQVGAVDAADNETRSAVRTITVDNGAPGAPQGLAVAARDVASPGFSASWRNPGGQVAPIEQARWVLCPADGGACSSGAAAASGDAGRLDGLSLPRPGRWTLAVYLVDAAGNASAGTASQVALDYADPSPPARVAPSPPPAATKRSPRLTVGSARLDRRRRMVTVRGTLARTARGRLTVTYRARIGRRTVARAAAITPRRGRFSARIRISAKEARGRARQVRVSYPGAGAYAAASRTVRVR